MTKSSTWFGPAMALAVLAMCIHAHAAEHVTLRNGFELDCSRQEPAGDHVRLYLISKSGSSEQSGNYIEVAADAIVGTEEIPDPPVQPQLSPATTSIKTTAGDSHTAALTQAEMQQMLARAGAQHNVDADLLASVVHAESGGQVHAISRAGAQGLMQLMPSTAAGLGVSDTFAPEQNIGGGTAYLDQLLTRYHDNLALALAAYNAGPAAVDRYHGIPPFAETRAYVARVIREFNRRKLSAANILSAKAVAH